MLSLNKNLLNTHTKIDLLCMYLQSFTVLHSDLWQGHFKPKLPKINQTTELINNSNKRAHVNPIYISLKLLSLDQILLLELQKFGYKLYHKHLPTPIIKDTEKFGNTSYGLKTHGYATRLKSLPNVLPHSGLKLNKGYLCKAITSFTKIPPDIQNLKWEKSFIRKIKLNLLNS